MVKIENYLEVVYGHGLCKNVGTEVIQRGRLKTQVRKTKVPEDGIRKYGIRKYECATVENVSTAT